MLAKQDKNHRATRAVVLALPDSQLTANTADRLHRAGWRVYRATSISTLRRLACRLEPEVVVVPAEGSDESGWLTCAKLLRGAPQLRVIVVGDKTTKGRALARFIGVEALVPADVTANALADHIAPAVYV
jgi:DNA-binding response OmpR family regulator